MLIADATLYVCVACRAAPDDASRPGLVLLDAVRARLSGNSSVRIAIEPADCLSVCKRPCTIALTAKGKWTYVIGDLTVDANIDDVIGATLAYAATENGIIPWRERPQSFRKGVISRVPPFLPLPEELEP